MSQPIHVLFRDIPQSPLAKRPPQKLVDIITTYFYEIETIRSCSTTCRSWYDAAKPLLYHSLTTLTNEGREWPGPLLEWHELGLLPFIKRFRITFRFFANGPGVTPERFRDRQNLRCFSALENLQELRIDHLVISDFMPNIEQYFGHFPTLRSLSLHYPTASYRQIGYLCGLFLNLQDFELSHQLHPDEEVGTAAILAPVPLFRPPLEGKLTLRGCSEEFVDEMIDLYGKRPLRFRHVCLSAGVECTQRVLNECAETLETFELVPHFRSYSYDMFTFPHLDLSRLKSLQVIKLVAKAFSSIPRDNHSFLKYLLSTIPSPHLELVIVFDETDFSTDCALGQPGHVGSAVGRAYDCLQCNECWCLIRALDKVYQDKERDFRLVLCVEVPGDAVGRVVGTLERHVEAYRRGEYQSPLSTLFSKSSIISTIIPPKRR